MSKAVARSRKAELAGDQRPARDLQKVARADRNERVLNVVGRSRNAHAGITQLTHAGESARRQLIGITALQEQIGGRQRDHGDAGFGKSRDDAFRRIRRGGTQRAAMTRGYAPLHAVGERPLDDGVEQKMAGVEVLVDMHIERQSASLRELEQKIEECERLVGILRNAADNIGAGADRCFEPTAGCVEPSRRIARQVRDDLQSEAVATALPQLDQRFDAANVAFSFDVGVAADRNRSVRETTVKRAFGPRQNLFARRNCGECPVRC